MDDPLKLYGELCEVVEEVIDHFEAEGRALPLPRLRPMHSRLSLSRDTAHVALKMVQIDRQ